MFLTGIALVVGEQYPLSDYPMYSQFKGEEYYLYITDGSGDPIPCKAFHTSAPKLKKRFKKHLKALAKEEDCDEEDVSAEGLDRIGTKTLESYVGTADADILKQTWQLVLVNIEYNDEGKIVSSERTIASYREGS